MPTAYEAPLAPTIQKWRREYTPGPLTSEQYNHFFEDGYVILRGNYIHNCEFKN
jgi:hypothetical protein